MATLFGMDMVDLPDNYMALEAIILVKVIDAEGNPKYVEISTPTLHPIEALGMVTTAADTLRNHLMTRARRGQSE